MAVTPGAIVITKLTGNDAMVVRSIGGEGSRAHVIGKRVNEAGEAVGYFGRTVGIGDVTLVEPARTYAPGEIIKLNDIAHEVAADLGDAVEFIVPQSRFRHSTGTVLRIPGGNKTVVAKSDLALAQLGE